MPETPTTNEPTSNVYERDGEWYFYDETEDEHGPFLDEAEAKCESARYGHWLHTGEVMCRQCGALCKLVTLRKDTTLAICPNNHNPHERAAE